MNTISYVVNTLLKAAPIAGFAILAVPGITFSATEPMSDEAIVENATSAAPSAVAKNAKVIQVTQDGEMRVVREGTNNFTCMADNPVSPGNDPMCLDENGMLWAGAWMGKTEPPADAIGFGYMLQGGSDSSNTDPFAAEPNVGAEWVDTGPHVMIFNFGSMMSGYPSQGNDPDTSNPYIMWDGTPYAHLMIPVTD